MFFLFFSFFSLIRAVSAHTKKEDLRYRPKVDDAGRAELTVLLGKSVWKVFRRTVSQLAKGGRECEVSLCRAVCR